MALKTWPNFMYFVIYCEEMSLNISGSFWSLECSCRCVNRVFGTSMVEEYEEIAESQYQSERQELFDEDYGKWL